MFRKIDPVKASRNKSIKWRSHEVLRVEGFSDAVFAFAMTLLVVSLEVPKTFIELKESMSGLIGFGLCFLLLLLIWYQQYLFFRQFHLKDLRTIVLNAALLFVVLVYVYPLKFMFALFTQGNHLEEEGKQLSRIANIDQLSQLFIIYGIGYILVYFVFMLMYQHAWAYRDIINLTQIERFHTKTQIYKQIVMMAVGVVQIAISLSATAKLVALSGMAYMLIAPGLMILFRYRENRMKTIFSPAQLEEHNLYLES